MVKLRLGGRYHTRGSEENPSSIVELVFTDSKDGYRGDNGIWYMTEDEGRSNVHDCWPDLELVMEAVDSESEVV